jgi:hypothetical protein
MDFSTALLWLRDGEAVFRNGWNDSIDVLRLQKPDDHSKMTRPYIYIATDSGTIVPWVASQTDLLSEDWEML